MNPDRQRAMDYLRAPANGLWRWAEDGAVLVWRDGTTVAFREEIIQVLEWLSPHGLPPFGAIACLLAACRGKVPDVTDILPAKNALLPPDQGREALLHWAARRQLEAQLREALCEISRISQLPAELNSRGIAKCVLAEVAFENAKVERHVQARAVLNGMRDPIPLADLMAAEGDGGRNEIRQLHIVAEGLKRHTAESLALRLRSGLDALPGQSEEALPASERARRLIEMLSRDRDCGAAARAAHDLMAAVRLPRWLGDQEPMALGGVADLTNRGPLDRLLLSELAHDDLTLAVRVALNEALYLRREPPMREPPGTLALLLDSGIRLWGVPRVLAAAVALALVARSRHIGEVQAWRAHGTQLHPVNLLSQRGLTEHLATLETDAHAGESVPAFAAALDPGAPAQSVVITHPDALADPDFRQALASHPGAPGFVATVDREGHFELHGLPLARRPPLCEATLDLASVFGGPAVVAPVKRDLDPHLPVIFSVAPFPFLLPLNGNVDCWVKGVDGFIYAVLGDRRLVRYQDLRSGGRVLAANLPAGKPLWMDCDGDAVHVVKAGSSQRPARLLSLSLPGGELQAKDLSSGEEVAAVCRYGDVILAIRQHDVRAYALTDGRMLGQMSNPHRWVHGRFFRGTSHFYFAAWDGERVKFEPVTMPSTLILTGVATVFDRAGHSGPWLLSRSGRIISSETGESIPLPGPPDPRLNFNVPRISRDGNQILVGRPTPPAGGRALGRLYDLERMSKKDNVPFSLRSLNLPPPLPCRNIYRFVESVVRVPEGLALRGRKKRWRKLVLGPLGKLCILPAPNLGDLPAEPLFNGLPREIKSAGVWLQTGQLSNGTTVFLDSYGILHLKSARPELPEVSVLLADGEVAGWTSDGGVCGPSFFFDGKYTSESNRVFEHLLNCLPAA